MRRFVISIVSLIAIMPISACYYVQAIRGHSEIMHARQPIADVVAADDTPHELARRLAMVQEARQYAIDELLLPDNKSYRSYADLKRDYVVWNVFAAPEFSLEPKTWCFPVAGCVAYRGYFSADKARKKATELSDDGYDVLVGGVSAYSTLGKFADPVLNTMLRWSDEQLVATIFHELAHQKLYIKGDTAFNESFATAVANTGIRRWLESRNDTAGMSRIARDQQLRRTIMSLIGSTRQQLGVLYRSDRDTHDKRARKQELMDALSAQVVTVLEQNGADAGNWSAQPVNNARLASFGLYEGGQAVFEKLLEDCSDELDCFYEQAERLAKLDRDERSALLEQLAVPQDSGDGAAPESIDY